MGIVENLKDAADLAKKVGDIELYRKIVHLEGEVIELTREKRHAEQKLEELEHHQALKAKMTFEQPFYRQEGDSVPYCPRCFEKDRAAIHVVLAYDEDYVIAWDCPQCKTRFSIRKEQRRRFQVAGEPEFGPWS